MIRLALRLIFFLVIVGPFTAMAHEMLPGYLEITRTQPGSYDLVWKLPTRQGNRLPLAPRFPDGCQLRGDLDSEVQKTAWIYRGSLRCQPELTGQTISIDGLMGVETDVLLRYIDPTGNRLQTALLTSDQPDIVIRTQEEVSDSGILFYLRLGVEHIMSGWDHLLFVLGLLLIVGNRWLLLKTITAFTVAHSLTLLIATLRVADIPSGLVETAVALSILFLGPEIFRRWRGETSLTIRFPWAVAFGFGLLHGLAFAGDLAEMGLPRDELVLALMLFNVGVEIGQLAFVILVLGLWQLARSLRIPTWVQYAPGYLVGTAGAYWTFDRIAVWLVF
jgi:hydrogenase/urease accessory protein HupE